MTTLVSTMLHELNSYVQSFASLRDSCIPIGASNEFLMDTREVRLQIPDHVRQFNRLGASEAAVIACTMNPV